MGGKVKGRLVASQHETPLWEQFSELLPILLVGREPESQRYFWVQNGTPYSI